MKGGQVSVTVDNYPAGPCHLHVYSATGQLVYAKSSDHTGGSVNVVLSLEGLLPGPYLLEVQGPLRLVRHLILP